MTSSKVLQLSVLVFSGFVVFSCGPSSETTKTETTVPPVMTKEGLFELGHQLYVHQNLDSALTVLTQAVAIDPMYQPVLVDLAPLHFDLASRTANAQQKANFLKHSRDYYVRLEEIGVRESGVYERICEIANMLSDDKTFLKYARKNAEAFPYDRQFYNLSVAYFEAEKYQDVIKLCKDAVEKFKESPFIGTFYRQLGRGYMKVDRDQTAERIFYAGLSVIETRISHRRRDNPEFQTSDDYTRLRDDKVGILTSLKYLHAVYKAKDKLATVERKLRELGQ